VSDAPIDIGICEACRREFHYRLIHNGFNDSAYIYCDQCGRCALFDGGKRSSAPFSPYLHSHIADPSLEALLKRCPCGGRLAVAAVPRCPHCRAEIDAVFATGYLERNAPGTKKGWRWQRSWRGLYSVIIEGQVLNDWLRDTQEADGDL